MTEKIDKTVNFYEAESLVSYKQDYYGSFAHITKECTVDGVKYEPGLYFGGTNGWEKLDNGKDFITKEVDDLTNYYTKDDIDDSESLIIEKINEVDANAVFAHDAINDITSTLVTSYLNSLD